MVPFGLRLKTLRKQAGLSQEKLAEQSGLHRQAIAKLELGTHEPSWGTVRALADALGVKCDAFTEEDSEVPPAKRPASPKKPARKKKA
jgi:transcriptional regulator with XRE-family HTH domain